MDPAPEFEQIRQQKQSEWMLTQNAARLAAEAREIVAKHPQAKAVGLVLADDSSEAALFRELVLRTSGEVAPPGHVVIVVPRKMALDILKLNSPATLEWLDSTPVRLPLVAATKDGHRLAAVNLETGELEAM
jgi:hypothetical protein